MDINKEAKGIFILLQHGQLGLSLTAPFVSMNGPSLMMNVCYTIEACSLRPPSGQQDDRVT